MKRYPSEHQGAHTAPGRCVELLAGSAQPGGIVLDIGCGRAPLAEQVQGLELEYVGVDVDESALAEVSKRGYETHLLDLNLGREELAAALTEAVAGRTLTAVLTVDVLEHLLTPAALLEAARPLASEGDTWSLIVSVPAITHLDIAAKLLLGRWDLTEFGLLDDTHVRFFSERQFVDLFTATGWREEQRADVISPISDQLFPSDAPMLRPGAPAREILHRFATRAHPNVATYQFVRRFVPAEPSGDGHHRWTMPREDDESRIFASVLVLAPEDADDLEELLSDLDAQTSRDFETILIGQDLDLGGREIRAIELGDPKAPFNSGIAAAEGRYLCFIDGSARVSPSWIESFQRSPEMAGHVLRADAVSSDDDLLSGEGPSAGIAAGRPLATNSLDLLLQEWPAASVLSSYAVPLEATRTAGVQFEPEYGASAAAVFLIRAAELCGALPVGQTTVAVPASAHFDSEGDLVAIRNALDEAPIVLPPGSASRIAEMLSGYEDSASWRMTKPLRGLKRILGRDR